MKAEKHLITKHGIQKRKQRYFDTEPMFANIKYVHNFKCFILTGKDKVSIDMDYWH
ncbi:transposase [[Flexibacter] sp. ATCC 35208]|uniref:transposase n=1 Tax=[Flexibacter] sp. ATCC 35208 TaxID=1936242 RepID=UPI0009FA1481